MAVVVSGLFGGDRAPQRGQAADAAPVHSGNAADRAAAAARLELKDNKRTREPLKRLVFKACRCKLRVCPVCGPQYGYRVRKGLIPKAKLFCKPALLTLTVARDKFESPEDAHSFVSNEGLIRRLLRFLDVNRWVWVLEFQSGSGAGWPHWHILIDLADVPGKRIDLKRAWHLWNDKWAIGGLDLQIKRRRLKADHAINYITKYLTKYPDKGYPLWVLLAQHRIRFFQASRSIGPVLSPALSAEPDGADDDMTPDAAAVAPDALADQQTTQSADDQTDDYPKPDKPRRPFRPLVERLAECGHGAMALIETDYGDGEPPQLEYLGKLDLRPGRLVLLASMEEIRSPVQVMHNVAFSDKHGLTRWLEPFMRETRRLTLKQLFETLQDELIARGEYRRKAAEVAVRIRALVEGNAFKPPADEPALPVVDDAGGPGAGDDLPF